MALQDFDSLIDRCRRCLALKPFLAYKDPSPQTLLRIFATLVWDPKPKHLVIIYGFEKKTQKWPSKHLENMGSQLEKYLAEEHRIGQRGV